MLAGARWLVSSRTRTHTRTRTRTHTPRYPDATDDQSDGDDADAIPTTERIKPIVATWPHASETILLAVLGVAEWQRRSRRCASDLGATAFSLVLLFILASLTAVGVDGVGDGGAGDLSSGVLLSPLHIRTSAREGSVGVAVLPPRQSDGTFDCSFRDTEAKELFVSACWTCEERCICDWRLSDGGGDPGCWANRCRGRVLRGCARLLHRRRHRSCITRA